jgi:hypothetical protein
MNPRGAKTVSSVPHVPVRFRLRAASYVQGSLAKALVLSHFGPWRGGRVVEGAPLLRGDRTRANPLFLQAYCAIHLGRWCRFVLANLLANPPALERQEGTSGPVRSPAGARGYDATLRRLSRTSELLALNVLVAQRIERRTSKPMVAGSSPAEHAISTLAAVKRQERGEG